MPVLNQLLDEKIVKLLLVLYKNKSKLYHLTQLAQEAKVSSATTLRLMKLLTKSGTASIVRVGKLKIYKYNDTEKNNRIMRLLEQ